MTEPERPVVQEPPPWPTGVVAEGSDAPEGALGIVGRPFMFPPSKRLLCAIDDASCALEALRALRGLVPGPEDIWVYRGKDGAERIDTTKGRHGPHVLLARLIQRIETNDEEYSAILKRTVLLGGVALGIRIGREDVRRAVAILHRFGAKAIVYCEHWNYVPVPPSSDEG